MYMYSTDSEEMTKNANVIKETILAALEREGLLKRPASEIGAEYAIVIHKKGWLGSLWEKLFTDINKDSYRVNLVKVV